MKSLWRLTLPVLAVIALVTACNTGSSNATTGLSAATVQSMINASIAPLQQQIAQLQNAATPAIYIQDPNQPATSVKEHNHTSGSSTSTCTGLGTLTGRPDTSNPLQTNNLSGVSCTGYYFTVSGAATSSDYAYVQPLPSSLAVMYTSTDCSGPPYLVQIPADYEWDGVPLGGVPPTVVPNGAVFTLGTQGGTDPTAYWMLPAGAAPVSVDMLSFIGSGNPQCINASAVVTGYALQENNSAITGVPSAPIPGPVTIG
jgi:hypothetical protein